MLTGGLHPLLMAETHKNMNEKTTPQLAQNAQVPTNSKMLFGLLVS
jgi:hypothetical protein